MPAGPRKSIRPRPVDMHKPLSVIRVDEVRARVVKTFFFNVEGQEFFFDQGFVRVLLNLVKSDCCGCFRVLAKSVEGMHLRVSFGTAVALWCG